MENTNTPRSAPYSRHPTNPLVLIREEHSLSQDDLANSAGITRQIVTTTESGIFSDIPPAILDALEFDFGVDRVMLNHRYHEWLKAELNLVNVANVTSITRTPGADGKDRIKVSIPVGIKSFREWRRELCAGNRVGDPTALSGFGKLIKMQPVLIRKYEDGRTKSLSQPLVDRLKFWGFPDEYLSELAGLPIGRKL